MTGPDRIDKTAAFRALHAGEIFVMPNVWSRGVARMFAGLGFGALATTSSGFAAQCAERDGVGAVTRDAALAHAEEIVASTALPVSADLENGFADAPETVAETIRLAAEAGLAGASIEDVGPSGAYDFAAACARIEAAAEAARSVDIVLTARADGVMTGHYDLDEASRRLRAFDRLGAEVLFAPGAADLAQISRLAAATPRPFNHVIGVSAGGLGLAELAEAGVRRVSLGGSLAKAALGATLEIGRALQEGRFERLERAASWSEIFDVIDSGR